MGAALAAADLVVSRAGASALGEYPFFGLPAVLVPYPHAWRYQKVNADVMARRGAVVVLEDRLLGAALMPLIAELLGDPSRLEAMRLAMRGLLQPGAADAIAGQLVELAETRSQ
jgi:UDP-N-acetylglucosamine--N-acetylmuramyl-(pentapeptide) pyrophosphoryl-undecaprenol N-acetylglucosamine transferase